MIFTESSGSSDDEKEDEKTDDKTEEVINDENGDPNKGKAVEAKEVDLDEDSLAALGEDPSKKEPPRLKLHSSLESRWKYWSTTAMESGEKTKILRQYPAPTGIIVPKLNPEVAAFLSESAVKRDKYFTDRQALTASALAALGSVLNVLIATKSNGDGAVLIDKKEALEKLKDVSMLLTHLMYTQTEARKYFILPGMEPNKKKILTNVETDEFLFGKNLNERIKEAKAIQKMTQDMKPLQPLKIAKAKNYNGQQARKPTSAWLGQSQRRKSENGRGRNFKNQPFNPKTQSSRRYKPREVEEKNQ